MSNVRLLIDFNNLAIRCLFSDISMISDPDPDFKIVTHKIMNSLIYNIRMHRPDEIILAVDGKGYWRRKIYDLYKGHRKDKRDKDIFDWSKYYDYIDGFLKDVKKTFPFKVIRIKWVEADDVISTISRMVPVNRENIIVSADKDFVQLTMNKSIKLYDPMKKIFIENIDSKRELDVKVIVGDKSDNIPNIKPKVGPKTAIKLLEDPEQLEALLDSHYIVPIRPSDCKHKWLEDDEENILCETCEMKGKAISVKENWERNSRLIDMSKIPNKIQQRILERYHECEIKQIGSMDIMRFCSRHNLRKIGQDSSMIHDNMKPLMGMKTDSDEMGEFF